MIMPPLIGRVESAETLLNRKRDKTLGLLLLPGGPVDHSRHIYAVNDKIRLVHERPPLLLLFVTSRYAVAVVDVARSLSRSMGSIGLTICKSNPASCDLRRSSS